MAVSSTGDVYVADRDNHLIRKISFNGNVSTIAGQVGISGSINGQGISSSFNTPVGVEVNSQGEIYVADQLNHLIRKIDLNGNVTSIAGKTGISGSSNGQGTEASFNRPTRLALDS